MAYFRGHRTVELDDLRQVLPFVLHDKLQPDLEAPFFDAPGNASLRRTASAGCAGCSTSPAPSTTGSTSTATIPRAALGTEFAADWTACPNRGPRRLARIERLIAEWAKGRKALRASLRRSAPAQIPAPALHQLSALAEDPVTGAPYHPQPASRPMVSSVFAQTLRSGREHFNARFAAARRVTPGLDAVGFSAFLAGAVDGVVQAVERTHPGRGADVAQAAYDLALELAGQRLFGGERGRWIEAGWKQLLPGVAGLVASDPVRLLGATTNALHTLAVTPGARPGEWIELQQRFGPFVSGDAAGVARPRPGRGLARGSGAFPRAGAAARGHLAAGGGTRRGRGGTGCDVVRGRRTPAA
jgi:hypothetical protein